jgi:hypothetical protein
VSATTSPYFSLALTRFKLLYQDWRGYPVAFFALVWVANQYMSIYNRLRLDIREEGIEIQETQEEMNNRKAMEKQNEFATTPTEI